MTFHPEDSSARSSPNYVLFTNDKSLVFTSFFADFGPLDLGHTYKFCTQLQDTLAKAHASGKPVVYSCSNHPHARSNGAVMMCAYMVRTLCECLRSLFTFHVIKLILQPCRFIPRYLCTTVPQNAPTDLSWVSPSTPHIIVALKFDQNLVFYLLFVHHPAQASTLRSSHSAMRDSASTPSPSPYWTVRERCAALSPWATSITRLST